MKKKFSIGIAGLVLSTVLKPVLAHEAPSAGVAHTAAHVVIGLAVLVCIAIAVQHTKSQRG